jgi:hypothetical protein
MDDADKDRQIAELQSKLAEASAVHANLRIEIAALQGRLEKPRRHFLGEAIKCCKSQLWGGESPDIAITNGDYRRGQWRGAHDCVTVLEGRLADDLAKDPP